MSVAAVMLEKACVLGNFKLVDEGSKDKSGEISCRYAATDGRIEIRGFGSFNVRQYEAYKGRDSTQERLYK